MDYPNDADGDVLRRIAGNGSDMSKPMEVDFAVAAPDEDSARAVAEAAAKRGYRTNVGRDDAGGWSCYCTRTMLATYDGVMAVQAELDGLGHPYGAHADGWGTFGNASGPRA